MKVVIKPSENNPTRAEIERTIATENGFLEFETTHRQVLQIIPTSCSVIPGTDDLRIEGRNAKLNDSRVGNLIGPGVVVTYNEKDRSGLSVIDVD